MYKMTVILYKEIALDYSNMIIDYYTKVHNNKKTGFPFV